MEGVLILEGSPGSGWGLLRFLGPRDVCGLGFRSLGFRVYNIGFRVQGSGFRVYRVYRVIGFRV